MRCFSSRLVSLAFVFFFQAEDGIRDLVRSRGLGDVYKRQVERSRQHLDPLLAKRRPGTAEADDTIDLLRTLRPVSYTHLTLPTIYPV